MNNLLLPCINQKDSSMLSLTTDIIQPTEKYTTNI